MLQESQDLVAEALRERDVQVQLVLDGLARLAHEVVVARHARLALGGAALGVGADPLQLALDQLGALVVLPLALRPGLGGAARALRPSV